MVAGAIFDGAPWVAPSAYFLGDIAAIICSGIILKKTKLFAGDPAPFVMELPAYHLPTVGTCIKKHVGAWMVIHQEGRNNHHTFNNHYLVHNILRIC